VWVSSCSWRGVKRRILIHNNEVLIGRRRELRRNATRAEVLLWACLRKCQLDGRGFRRQHSIGPYIVDFYCPECRVIVELDGAGHFGLGNAGRDDARRKFLESLGCKILRFENEQVVKNRKWVIESIRALLRATA